MDLTNCKHFIKLFLLVKTTFSMMEHTLLNIQPIHKNVTTFLGLPDTISEWEFKGLSN